MIEEGIVGKNTRSHDVLNNLLMALEELQASVQQAKADLGAGRLSSDDLAYEISVIEVEVELCGPKVLQAIAEGAP